MDRRNNFDLLRLAAATLVLFSHCWGLTEHGSDPVELLTLHVFAGGELGVWIFFAISGYLVTASFVHRGSLGAFAKARFLRIYPAFVAALGYDIIVGAIVTSLPLTAFLADSRTLAYVGGNLLFDIHYHLPGVFEHNPHGSLVNGSLWTLPGELFMYCLVAMLGVAGVLHRPKLAGVVLFAATIVLAAWPAAIVHLPLIVETRLAQPMACFLVGTGLFVFRQEIPLDWRAAIVALVLAAAVGTLGPRILASLLACAAISYAALTVALRTRPIEISPTIGDISYGMYIYAYPLQQVIGGFGVGPWTMFAFAFPCTFVLAWLSWHGIEKRALALKADRHPVLVHPIKNHL